MSNAGVGDHRFRFGANWLDFSRTLGADQLTEAEKSLRRLLGCDTLAGLRFLDIGSVSGLFSLAARQLGSRVLSTSRSCGWQTLRWDATFDRMSPVITACAEWTSCMVCTIGWEATLTNRFWHRKLTR